MNNNRNKSSNVVFSLRVAASSPLLCRRTLPPSFVGGREGSATRRLRYILSDDYDDMFYTLLLTNVNMYTAFGRDRDLV